MGLTPFEKKVYLSSPTMHGEELQYMTEAYETNWMSTVGANINEVERITAEKIGCKYAVGLACGTAALHLAIRLAGMKLYGKEASDSVRPAYRGTLAGHRVFCTDMTFGATVNPIAYEGGEAIFIDSEYETWNMDPKALRRAFDAFPEVRLVVVANLYGTPAQLEEIRNICNEHAAILIEDAAESLGATYHRRQTGNFGTFNAISFNGNKIITGSAGGMLLTDDAEAAALARKWSTQSREPAPWYQHIDLGYNYRMSNVVAGVVRGQYPHLEEHIAQKRAIYKRYSEAFADLPVSMNPYIQGEMEPNNWLSCLIINPEAMCSQTRDDLTASYVSEPGKTCPTEILDAITAINAEGRPIWKPMHMQPMYSGHAYVTAGGVYTAGRDAEASCVGEDIFARGLCLPSDNKMTAEQQDKIIEAVRSCF